MTTSTIIILLGIVSSTTLVLSALSVHKKRILSLSLVTGSVVGVQYGLAGSWVGLATLTIGLGWTILMLLSERFPALRHWGFIPAFSLLHLSAFIILSNWSTVEPVNFIPLVGGILGLIALYFRKVIYIKSTLIFLGLIWLVYEQHMTLYGQMIGEGLTLVANTAALITLIIAAKKGIPQRDVEDLDEKFLDTITQSIPVLTGSIRIPKNKAVRGAHPTSVGYARILEEQELSDSQK